MLKHRFDTHWLFAEQVLPLPHGVMLRLSVTLAKLSPQLLQPVFTRLPQPVSVTVPGQAAGAVSLNVKRISPLPSLDCRAVCVTSVNVGLVFWRGSVVDSVPPLVATLKPPIERLSFAFSTKVIESSLPGATDVGHVVPPHSKRTVGF